VEWKDFVYKSTYFEQRLKFIFEKPEKKVNYLLSSPVDILRDLLVNKPILKNVSNQSQKRVNIGDLCSAFTQMYWLKTV